MKEVSLKKANYSDDDVFILDLGNAIYQINGIYFIFKYNMSYL